MIHLYVRILPAPISANVRMDSKKIPMVDVSMWTSVASTMVDVLIDVSTNMVHTNVIVMMGMLHIDVINCDHNIFPSIIQI